ncbi:Acetyltransferase (GNAT) family protein [Austwickia chelonae]|uniref:N-acetyltransferase domain-containing protein n=1 Tax=Austwickia chelonae NBRC 105200 TaxID=1184607 RepID=K6V442_9MICO|nr:GNAT family N-acetyltransferase [Austwickia chelonae]GAB76908.1 hypothetical protein AUCHE_03_01250 [Austwickia chelonae NBRC 105200]SEW32229.1 Acetyltransferase (GNAT) family protein [Austwickia chelonae]
MIETTVRRLSEEEWTTYRDLRLTALAESPEAFVKSFAEEKNYDEELWRARMRRAERLVASTGGKDVGILSLRQADEEFEESAEIFGMWVTAELRGQGVATVLLQDAIREAKARGYDHLVYWVGTENARGVGFATGRGFRPSEQRRPMNRETTDESEEEIALVLSLS